MKKLATLVVLFLVGMTAHANVVSNLDQIDNRGPRYNNNTQNIQFIQKGITFIVHANGTFTFRSPRAINTGRRGVSQAPGHTYYGVNYVNRNNNRLVSYNRNGVITRVGRNVVTYNRYGKVQRIGNVVLRYRNGRLIRAGHMNINYSRNGRIINTHGNVIRGVRR